MSQTYILEGKTPKRVEGPEWAKWFEKAERHVGLTEKDGVKVSTVFLGLDYSFNVGPPLLFETMIFGGEHNEYQRRYSTYEGAEIGHEIACRIAFEGETP